jgi:IclR family acetate operon transcriptional repressor
MGKALLAFGPESVEDAVRGLEDLESTASRTKTTKRALIAELKKARERGYTISVEEEFEGICSVAAPVISADGTASAALELAGPVSRVSAEQLAEFARILAGGAGTIEHDPETGYLV